MSATIQSLASALLCLGLLGPGLAQPVIDGDRLVTPEGLSLYVFDNDAVGSGKSVCHAACANVFPALRVEAGETPAEPFGVVIRDDGSRQWAYKGRP